MEIKGHGLPIKIELPEHYLEEEVRCDYTVSRKMKEVWAVELDLLSELARVCSKHNIEFYAEGGTLLGCIRHKGFIPWDDDIDIAMTRDNYRKLCAATDDFHFPYFLQTEQTDFGSMRGHAQLRNSLTTGALESETDLQINQGIFIDIFPMDVVPDAPEAFENQKEDIYKFKKKAFFYGRKLFSLSKKSKLKRAIKLAIIKMPFTRNYIIRKSKSYYKKFEDACSRFDSSDEERISLLSFKCYETGYIRKRSYYDRHP